MAGKKNEIPGPKTCVKCGSRGKCKDSRQALEVVERRYSCEKCSHKWMSYEVTLTEKEINAEGDDNGDE